MIEPYAFSICGHQMLLATDAASLLEFDTSDCAASFVEVYNNSQSLGGAGVGLLAFPVRVSSSGSDSTCPLPLCLVCIGRLSPSFSKLSSSPVLSGYGGNAVIGHCETCFRYGASCAGREEDLPFCNVDGCNLKENIWLCLVCSHAGCGRYTKQHAEQHYRQTQHPFALELVTGRVWSYAHDTFVNHEAGMVRISSSSSSSSSFSSTAAAGAAGGQVHATKATREPTPTPAALERKIQTVQSDYEQLLLSQLEAQRLFFEKLLAQETVRALGGGEASEDELCEIERQKLEISRLEAEYADVLSETRRVEQETRKMRKANDALIREQKELREREQRTRERVKEKKAMVAARVNDLSQQLQDLNFFLRGRSEVLSLGGQGGDVVGVRLHK